MSNNVTVLPIGSPGGIYIDENVLAPHRMRIIGHGIQFRLRRGVLGRQMGQRTNEVPSDATYGKDVTSMAGLKGSTRIGLDRGPVPTAGAGASGAGACQLTRVRDSRTLATTVSN